MRCLAVLLCCLNGCTLGLQPARYDRQGLAGCVRLSRGGLWSQSEVLVATGSATLEQCIRALAR